MVSSFQYRPDAPLVIIVGNFGSGKTEVSVNLALNWVRSGPVKIVDLGLARGMAAVPSERITEIGVLVGTPEFMAPEQARDPTAVDGRADLYALGATLYFALTGKPPVEGRTTLEILSPDSFRETFELAGPGKEWACTITNELHRAL